jgi:hypothetical protein
MNVNVSYFEERNELQETENRFTRKIFGSKPEIWDIA